MSRSTTGFSPSSFPLPSQGRGRGLGLVKMTFAWQGFEFQHPDDWECVRFSKNRARGECAFADRKGQRLSLIWSACGAGFQPATLKAIMDACAQQLSREDKAGRIVNPNW